MSKKIAIISTSCPLLEGKAAKLETGSWLEEIATPYYAFKAAKHEVSIVSIAGGVVPVDGGSTQGDFYTDDCKQFTADAEAQALMKDSPSIDAFDFGKVDAIYLAGGHGTVKDFYGNKKLHTIIADAYKAGKVVAADCHGPVALVGCKIDDEFLVNGKEVTGFTNAEEDAVNHTALCRELNDGQTIEDGLKKCGGKFVGGADWGSNVCVAGNLVTGQNPASSRACAEAVLKVLG